MIKKMFLKAVTFFIKKKVQSATGELEEVSKTKIFMTLEGILQAIEFISPFFGNPIQFPAEIHKAIWSLAGLSYAERQLKK